MNILRKINKYAFLIIIAVLTAMLIFQPDVGIVSLIRLYAKKNAYETSLIEMKARIILMQDKVQRLKYDEAYIETIIREELGMIRRGEKIIRKTEE